MNQPSYAFERTPDNLIYKFWSVGKNGNILKIVIFQQVSSEVFNLVLGNYDEDTEAIDDKTITDNGDMSKIIVTVIHTIVSFFENYPEKLIYIEGNHPTKQKLYQRIIKNNINDFNTNYNLFGVLPNEDIELLKLEANYQAFVIQLKPLIP